MKILAKTTELSREQWLEQRRRGVCGSDASTVLGLNPYHSILHLWKDKRGLLPAEENSSEYAYFGNVMEPVIKREFTKRTGLKVRAKNAILQSSEHAFMLADVDGLVKEADGSISVFEAKTASAYKEDVWKKLITRRDNLSGKATASSVSQEERIDTLLTFFTETFYKENFNAEDIFECDKKYNICIFLK